MSICLQCILRDGIVSRLVLQKEWDRKLTQEVRQVFRAMWGKEDTEPQGPGAAARVCVT